MSKRILLVLVVLLLFCTNASAQSITAGIGKYRTSLEDNKFKTTTKIEHIANNSAQPINVSVITYYVKEQYTGGTYYYNKILSSRNVGIIYPGQAIFNVRFNNKIKPFSKKGYVYTLIYDQDTGTPYWFYNYGKKVNFGNLLRSSSGKSVLVSSGIAE